MNPEEVAGMEFPVVMRGYAREEVQAFLVGVADELSGRDARLARLEAEVARLSQAGTAAALPQPASAGERAALLKQLGEEAAAILACADASAERIKARAVDTTEKVRHDLVSIGTSLGDVHQLLGELVSLVQGLSDGAIFNPPAEVSVAEKAPSGPAEVRAVLGEVLGLDPNGKEIHIPEESEVPGAS